jgi:hypothetical protein
MNWEASGIDGLHNFWWKKITSSHSHLAKHFNHKFMVIPFLEYTFVVIDWSDTDLEALNKTRVLLTKYRIHHSKSCTERLYLPRSLGGRGLVDLKYLCYRQPIKIREYFLKSDLPLCKQIVWLDKNHTALQLGKEVNITTTIPLDRLNFWLGKPLHGQFPNILLDANVDKEQSTLWLKKGQLQTETEGFICAIQDQVVTTKYYQKHILRNTNDDICRLCNGQAETIHHVITGCLVLAPTDYKNRHDQVAKIIHTELAKIHNFLQTSPPYYIYSPDPYMENDLAKLYWDKQITFDKTPEYNKPDIILRDRETNKGIIIDTASLTPKTSRKLLAPRSPNINLFA